MRVIETVEKKIERAPWITEQQAEDLCCEPTNMPPCLEKTEDWAGYTEEEILDRLGIDVADGRDAAGNIVEVRLLNRNSDGLCGKQVTKQIKQQKACCDGVEAIAWDYDNSAEVIADGSSGLVFVTGGVTPYSWSVRGDGFSLDASGYIRDGQTIEPSVRIYTSNSCGPCAVYVTDGCSSTDESVRSSLGFWVFVARDCIISAPDQRRDIYQDALKEYFTTASGGYFSNPRYFIRGAYKVEQSITRQASWAEGNGGWFCTHNLHPPYEPLCVQVPFSMVECSVDNVYTLSNPDTVSMPPPYYWGTICVDTKFKPYTYRWQC